MFLPSFPCKLIVEFWLNSLCGLIDRRYHPSITKNQKEMEKTLDLESTGQPRRKQTLPNHAQLCSLVWREGPASWVASAHLTPSLRRQASVDFGVFRAPDIFSPPLGLRELFVWLFNRKKLTVIPCAFAGTCAIKMVFGVCRWGRGGSWRMEASAWRQEFNNTGGFPSLLSPFFPLSSSFYLCFFFDLILVTVP